MTLNNRLKSLYKFVQISSVFKQKSEFKHIEKSSSVFLLLLLSFLTTIVPIKSFSQIQNEAEWNGFGYSLKKIVSNTSIESGVNFSYTIMFTAPAGATSVNISDEIPTNLVLVSVPVPAAVNGVNPTITTTGVPGVNETVNYSLNILSGNASSGSFTIVVKFPEGETCNNTAARNRASILINDKLYYTPYVSTTAIAADPWKISKSILSGPVVNPNGGSCGYIIDPGDTVTYRLSVLKDSPYFGNVVGQQNMSNAVVTDVLPAGAVMLSSTCGIPANSTGTITWIPNSGNLNAATPYAYYYCDITVYYPVSSFPVGTTVNNQIDLSGDMCGQTITHTSNQTCIEIANIVPNLNAYFNKGIYLTNRVPGCQGFYRISFCNTGNTSLAPFNINDVIPSGITVNQIKLFGGSSTTVMNLTANTGNDIIGSNITSNYFDSGILGISVNNLQIQMTGNLPVGQCIHMYVYFEVGPNPTGTIVENCASFDGLTNNLSLPDACISFTVDSGQPHACLNKDICSPLASYNPGDTVRFRLRVQNIGSADISGASISDNLHSNFSYLGNESYYIANSYNPSCSSGGGIPAGTTAWTGVATNHTGNNLEWSIPDVPSDCQLFYVGYCGYYGTWGLPYYFIEFDATIDSFAMPGVTPNYFEISGGSISGTVTSNTTNVLVVASLGQEVSKQISTDNGATFGTSATVVPNSSVRYRLNYKNTSNVPVSSVTMVDLLPMDDGANDWLILNRSAPRGSQFGVSYNGNHSTSLSGGTPPSPSLSFAQGMNICLPVFGVSSGCSPATWGTTPDQNIKIDYGTFLLGTNVIVSEDFDVTISPNATNQQKACNDFATVSTANFLLNGVPQAVALTPISAPPVCVVVDSAPTMSFCCDSTTLESFYDPDLQGECCTELITDCEVDSIQVTIVNGTFASASWNCGQIPSVYVGQSSFTFDANQCVANLRTCVNSNNTGVVSMSFLVFFTNGETCEKDIRLECGTQVGNCCDSVEVKQVVGANGVPECCTEIITHCEVDSIETFVSNGTFSANSWNCGATIPSAAIGLSSFTFVSNGCEVDMKNCLNANQTGVVNVNYLVYFSNGETCEQSIQIRCEVQEANCCDSIEVKQVEGAAGPECCTEIITHCEVDSILTTVSNGTFSANSWNCGATIPSAAIGLSSFTFVSNGCEVDMKNCLNANQTGVVNVNYLVYFSNGETCEQSIQIRCNADSTGSGINNQNYLSPDLFEFLNLYPNPTNGIFTIKFAIGNKNPVEIRIVNSLGQIVRTFDTGDNIPGINSFDIDLSTYYIKGLYKIVLFSGEKVLSKSVVIY